MDAVMKSESIHGIFMFERVVWLASFPNTE